MRSETDKKLHAEYFDTLPEKEIRRRQDLCEKQIKIAYNQGNLKGLENLRMMAQDLMEAMLRRC